MKALTINGSHKWQPNPYEPCSVMHSAVWAMPRLPVQSWRPIPSDVLVRCIHCCNSDTIFVCQVRLNINQTIITCCNSPTHNYQRSMSNLVRTIVDVRNFGTNARQSSPVPGTRYQVLVPGTGHLAPGTMYLAQGTWYQIPGTRHLVPGRCPGTRPRYQVPLAQYLVPGT